MSVSLARRTRPRGVLLSIVVALTQGSCRESLGPTQDLSISFCGWTPAFFAFASQGGDWARVDPDGAGVFRFRATDRLSIAFTGGVVSAQPITTWVYNLTAAELPAVANYGCSESPQLAKHLSLSVVGVGAGKWAMVAMGTQYVVLNPATVPSLSFGPLASGPLDIVARSGTYVNGQLGVERWLVRRAVDLADNATIPVLDFGAGGESLPDATGTLTIAGLGAGEFATLIHDFRSAGGTKQHIQSRTVSDGPVTISGVPASLTVDGDVHSLMLVAPSADGSRPRTVTQLYRQPGDRAISVGPFLSMPVLSVLRETPAFVFRTTLAGQAPYGSFAYAKLTQYSPTSLGILAENTVEMVTTVEFLGAIPVEWQLDVPNLARVSGFPSQAGLQGDITTVEARACEGPLSVFLGAGEAGANLRCARASGVSWSP